MTKSLQDRSSVILIFFFLSCIINLFIYHLNPKTEKLFFFLMEVEMVTAKVRVLAHSSLLVHTK